MKKVLFFFALVAFLVACQSEKINFSQLQNRNGIFYKVNDQDPFSGSVESFSDGRKEFEGTLKDGLREGLWVYYYPSGQKKSEGTFKNGVKDGTWTYYAENGTSLGTENYKDGTRLGNQVMPEEGDTSMTEEVVEEDVDLAASKKSGKEEAVKEKVVYVEKESGTSTKSTETSKAPLEYHLLTGAAIKFYQGKPYSGPVIDYQPNGHKRFEGQYLEGHKDGKWTYYDIHGNIKTFKYYSAPVVKESKQQEGDALNYRLLHGAAVKYYQGVPYTGAVIDYQPNGNKRFEGYFHNGRKSGKWTYYDIHGRVKEVKYY